MRNSLYWDDFARRVDETVTAIKSNGTPPVRRVAVFITNHCNFKCSYCNNHSGKNTLTEKQFEDVLEKYGSTAIIHITGGEPSTVSWLYPFLINNGNKYRFHLNTNAYITPPFEYIKRLKISLDSYNATYWNLLVGRNNAFEKVCHNIKESMTKTVTSLTYTLTKQNYKDVIDFTRFTNKEFPNIYAVFFSVYKGTNPIFVMEEEDSRIFFEEIIPNLKKELPEESLALLTETIDEKRRLMQGIRFPDNSDNNVCYISMSERVISPKGQEYTCSHLYRDGIFNETANKCSRCLYGCNQRLVMFNKAVEKKLKEE